ncbi:hypothetical protein SAMN05444365_10561 [Micromonospora pattaloongensis]|uniref:Uncharacterized protein n=1 Tax=Micromonospora pattaloongensis TaxID=405436 RepID=A0A1H3PWK2_9ACTN|nr:hypothetical protein [Micromonospora pattaloongensis]SDZ05205.1 hypothetical protein SAMN05444365_10561 [Micromonospora pattaloongensis]
MFPYPDVHDALRAHEARAAELRALATHDRLVRAARPRPQPQPVRWIGRLLRRPRHGGTRTPALP